MGGHIPHKFTSEMFVLKADQAFISTLPGFQGVELIPDAVGCLAIHNFHTRDKALFFKLLYSVSFQSFFSLFHTIRMKSGTWFEFNIGYTIRRNNRKTLFFYV